jgi:hypothetical protein
VRFRRYIGIDYSGAETPSSRLDGLQVYESRADRPDATRQTPNSTKSSKWTRKEIAHWIAKQLENDEPTLIGIDHAFSLPRSFLDRHALDTWDQFLDDFCQHWPTDRDHVYVDFLREDNPRTGTTADGLRLTERWTSSAKCVFQFDCQGSVAKSTHSGIPWLHYLRDLSELAGRVHFWPFDGFDIPDARSVIVEVYPSLFRNRFAREGRTADQQDAYVVACWMKAMDERNVLARYFEPPLDAEERLIARREGWILGVA